MRWVCRRKFEVVSFELYDLDVGFLLYFFENSNTCDLTHMKIPKFYPPEDLPVEKISEWCDVVSTDQFGLHDCIARNCPNIIELEVTVKVLMYSEGKHKNYISYKLFSLPSITKLKLELEFVLRNDVLDNRFPYDMCIRYAVIDRRVDCIDPYLLVDLIGGLERLKVLNLSGRHFCIWENKQAFWDPPTFVIESQSLERVEVNFPYECFFIYHCPQLKTSWASQLLLGEEDTDIAKAGPHSSYEKHQDSPYQLSSEEERKVPGR